MGKIIKSIGLILVVLGACLIVQIAFGLPEYFKDFPNNPISQYVLGDPGKAYLIKVDDSDITISKDIVRIIALFFAFTFIKIWVSLASILIKSGKTLVLNDKAKSKEAQPSATNDRNI